MYVYIHIYMYIYVYNIQQGWWWKTTYLELKVSCDQSSAK